MKRTSVLFAMTAALAVVLSLGGCAASNKARQAEGICRTIAAETGKDEAWIKACRSTDTSVMKAGVSDLLETRPPAEVCEISMRTADHTARKKMVEDVIAKRNIDCKSGEGAMARKVAAEMPVQQMCLKQMMPLYSPLLGKEVDAVIKERKIDCNAVLAVTFPNRGAAAQGNPSFQVLPDGSRVLSVKTK
jgi:hypothetical protein